MAVKRKTARKTSTRGSTARRTTARKVARKTSVRRSTVRRKTVKRAVRKVATRRAVRKPVRKRATVSRARKVVRRKASPSLKRITAVPKRTSKDHDLAAMYLSILIVGVAGIILLFAKPTIMMQKVVGTLLVILGLWGLMMKK